MLSIFLKVLKNIQAKELRTPDILPLSDEQNQESLHVMPGPEGDKDFWKKNIQYLREEDVRGLPYDHGSGVYDLFPDGIQYKLPVQNAQVLYNV